MTKKPCGRPWAGRSGAFTLIEIIVAMTIIAVIAAVAVPTLKGLNEDAGTRAPMQDLEEMVQEVRQRAMKDRRPYEIVFERDGLHAIPGSRIFPERDAFLKHLEELRTPPVRPAFGQAKPEKTEVKKEAAPSGPDPRPMRQEREGETPAAGGEEPPEMPWTLSIPMEAKMQCEVLMWGDGEWDLLEGDRMRRWVFQANGMACPARVRLTIGTTRLEASFDPLTGGLNSESARPAPTTAAR